MAEKTKGPASSGVVSSSIKLVLGYASAPLLGMIAGVCLARVLGPEGRGAVAEIIAPLLLAIPLATLGIPEACTYFVSSKGRLPEKTLRRLFHVLTISSVVCGVLVAGAVFFLMRDRISTWILVCLVLATLPLVSYVGLIRGITGGEQRWGYVSVERTVGNVLRLVLVLAFVLTATLSVTSAVFCLTLAMFGGGLVYFRKPRDTRDRSAVEPGEVLGYGRRVFVGTLSTVFLIRLDQILLVPLSNEEQLGLFVVAVTLAELPLVVDSAVKDSVLAADAKRNDDTMIGRAARISTLVVFLLSLILGVAAIFLVPVVYGQAFAGVVPPLLILMVGIVLGNPGTVAGAALAARDRPELRAGVMFAAAVLRVILLIVLAPALGAIGAAIAGSISICLAGIATALFAKFVLGIPFTSLYVIRPEDFRMIYNLAAKRVPGLKELTPRN